MRRIRKAAVMLPLVLSVFMFGLFCAASRTAVISAHAEGGEQLSEEEEAPGDISECSAVLSENVFVYEGRPVKPLEYLTVTDGNKTLIEGSDYICSFRNYTKPSQARVILRGIGSYCGSTELSYYIVPQRAEITSLTSGSGGVRAEWKKAAYALGYQVIYSRTADFSEYHSTTVKDPECTFVNLTNVPRPGERWYVRVRAFISEDGGFTSQRFGIYSEARSVMTYREIAKVTIPHIAYNQNGTAIKPAVKVWDALGKRIPEEYYTVSYSDNRAPGTARITVKGLNGVRGSCVREFYIRPPKLTITSLTSYKKGFKLTWSAAPAGTVGYQVLYSKDRTFKKDVHSYTSADLGDLSECFTRVPTTGETWYVKVRAFVSKDGTPNSTRYGYYSDVRSVTTVLYMQKTSRDAQLYPAAHYSPSSLGTVKQGTVVGVLEVNGLWYKIMYEGRTGWVYGKAFGKSAGIVQKSLTASNVEAYADDVLFEIGCSTRAIYFYVCGHVRYNSGLDNASRNFKAARALQYGWGPCYYSAATADLFLDRAGYEHEIMRGVQHGDVHNWNSYVKDGVTLYMETTYATYRPQFYDMDRSYLLKLGFSWR